VSIRLLMLVATGAALTALPVYAADMSVKDQLIAVDNAFAAEAKAKGGAVAFRDYMDPTDGLQFAGGKQPIRGAEAIFQAEGGGKPAGDLVWTPSEALAGAAGDMGVTWGRWSFTPLVKGAKAVTGLYVTVWRKDAAGHWKGLIDIGNPD
jgi:ketosteroid isomerase-like protein